MTCDYCGKKTADLQDLDYCSVCVDCLGEIENEEENPFDTSHNSFNDNNN